MQGYYDILNRIMTDPFVDSMVAGIVQKVLLICGATTGFFFIIGMIWNIVRTTTKLGPKMFEFQEFGRLLVIMFALTIYIPLMGIVNEVGESFAEAFVVEDSDLRSYQKYLDSQYDGTTYGTIPDEVKEKMKKNGYNIDNLENTGQDTEGNHVSLQSKDQGVVDENGQQSSWTDSLDIFLTPGDAIAAILEALLFIIAQAIRIVISLILIYLVKILYIVGPLAFLFSMLPMFREKAGEWFSAYVNCLFCFTTFNLLDSLLIHNLFGQIGDMANSQGQTFFPRIVMHLVTVILYPMVFWLTAKYVGTDSAGKVFNQALQTAAIVAGGWGGKVSSALSTSGGGEQKANSGESIANTGADGIRTS
jgi:flagellar biosynthesis protein FliQ